MSYSILRTGLLVLLVVFGACRQAGVEEVVADNEVLRQLYEADQQARKVDLTTLTQEEMLAFIQEDAERLRQVEALLEAGEARKAPDYFHAAMVFQHSEAPIHFRKAYELARDAYRLDSTFTSAGGLMAKAHDRYLGSIGQPQIYATQIEYQDSVYALAPIDTTQVTDDERRRLGLRTVPEMRAIVACLQAGGTIETCTQ